MNFISHPNSWLALQDSPTVQLTYGLQVNPAPLTVSLENRDPTLGSLQFVITNSTSTELEINQIVFTIQVGSQGSNLTQSTGGILHNVSDKNHWQIIPPGETTTGPAAFTLQPVTGQSVKMQSGSSIVVELLNFSTVKVPGSTSVQVTESIVGKDKTSTSFQLTTFPAGFFFKDLTANVQDGSQLKPAAQVEAGTTVTLTWQSSCTELSSFKILHSDGAINPDPATPTNTGKWTSPPLNSDTVFIVILTVDDDMGAPMTATLFTSVSIRNPKLIASSINAKTALIDELTVGSNPTSDTSATGLSINSKNIVNLCPEPDATKGTVGIGWNTNNPYETYMLSINCHGDTGGLCISGSSSSSGEAMRLIGNALVQGNLTVATESQNLSDITIDDSITSINPDGITTPSIVVQKAVSADSVKANSLDIKDTVSASSVTIYGLKISPGLMPSQVFIGDAPPRPGFLPLLGVAAMNIFHSSKTSGLTIIRTDQSDSCFGLAVLGGQCYNNSGSWTTSSDVTLKERIEPYEDGLEQVLAIEPIEFSYKESSGLSTRRHIGVSAQQLQEVAPYMVGKARLSADNPNEYLHVENGPMTYMLINAVKELHAEIQLLKNNLTLRDKEEVTVTSTSGLKKNEPPTV